MGSFVSWHRLRWELARPEWADILQESTPHPCFPTSSLHASLGPHTLYTHMACQLGQGGDLDF